MKWVPTLHWVNEKKGRNGSRPFTGAQNICSGPDSSLDRQIYEMGPDPSQGRQTNEMGPEK